MNYLSASYEASKPKKCNAASCGESTLVLGRIELSGELHISRKMGAIRTGIKSEAEEAYFREGPMTFKEKVHVALILVGGIRSFLVAEGLVEQGVADYISMSRPFIREPDLISRWRSGGIKKARCVSDNRCFKPIAEGGSVRCVREMK
jgi:2,4-dienoyl-CoA reductase-like NADH-dependent reductase (Old Yellow Enzyme family)